MSAKRRGWGIGGIFMAVFLITLLFVSLYFTLSFFESFLQGIDFRSVTSLDWAGYAVTSSYLSPQPVVVSVSGSWTVPEVTPSQADKFSAAWIGIGGQVDTTLIQVGTEHDSLNGKGAYSAWYELLPDISNTITSINVSSGDQIKASISLVDSINNRWSVEIRDVTKGQQFQNEFIYNSSRLSAEWIIERPTVNNVITSLADFGTATFADSVATVETTSGAIADFAYLRITMQDRQNNPLVTVSPLDSKGAGFTVSYNRVASTQNGSTHALESDKEASVAVRRVRKVAEMKVGI